MLISTGTGQRKQDKLKTISGGEEVFRFRVPGPLREFTEWVETEATTRFAGILPEGYGLRQPVVLGNDPEEAGRPPAPAQQLHMDLAPEMKGYVMFVPLAPASVLVVPCSHVWARQWARLQRKKHDEAVIAATMPKYPVTRLELHPGQVLIMDGNLVHAGDAGRPGEWTPRLHWYIQRPLVVPNDTHLDTTLGGRFAAAFDT